MHASHLALGLALCALAPTVQAQSLNYTEDFESFTPGSVVGQAGWIGQDPAAAQIVSTGLPGWGARSVALTPTSLFGSPNLLGSPLGSWSAPEGRFSMDVMITANTGPSTFVFYVDQPAAPQNAQVDMGVGTIRTASVNSGLLFWNSTSGTWLPNVPFRLGIEVEDGGFLRIYVDGQVVGNGVVKFPSSVGPNTRIGVSLLTPFAGASPGTLFLDNIVYETCPLPVDYCPATPNSNNPAGADLIYFGSRFLEANDGELITFGAAAGVPAVYVASTSQAQIPFGNGFLCLGAPRKRLGPTLTTTPSNLPFSIGGNAFKALDFTSPPLDQITPGSTWNFQLWFRDNAAGGAGTNLSDAVSVTFCQ